jgi:hypothetical protein
MWVNINYLIRFVSEYNPFLLELNTNAVSPKETQIKIPGYSMISKLVGNYEGVPLQKFREMLSYNISPLLLSEVEDVIKKYFCGENGYVRNKINITEL